MPLRIVAISDIHQHHRLLKLPEGDMLLVAGDITNNGSMKVLTDFANWLKELPFTSKCVVAGNHDRFERQNHDLAVALIREAGAVYLEDSSVEIEGIHIHGSPITPTFGYGWAWNRDRGADIAKHWALIPQSTKILMTHGMPYGLLDDVEEAIGQFRHPGCYDLLQRIKQLPNLKLMVGGHYHLRGQQQIVQDGITYWNAAVCDERYQPTHPILTFDL